MAVTTPDEVDAVNIAVKALEPRLRHINQTVNELSLTLQTLSLTATSDLGKSRTRLGRAQST